MLSNQTLTHPFCLHCVGLTRYKADHNANENYRMSQTGPGMTNLATKLSNVMNYPIKVHDC